MGGCCTNLEILPDASPLCYCYYCCYFVGTLTATFAVAVVGSTDLVDVAYSKFVVAAVAKADADGVFPADAVVSAGKEPALYLPNHYHFG